MRIILDCDDVLFRCNETSLELLNAELKTDYELSDITAWGTLNNDLDKRIKYFNMPEFVRRLQPYDDAKEFVKKLSEIAEIFICTTVPVNCLTARVESILEHFPEIPRDNIFLSGRKDILNADIILDDNPKNLIESNCKYPVLMQRPWNYNSSGFISVSTYEAFLELVKSIVSPLVINDYKAIAIVGPSGCGKKDYCKKLIDESNETVEQVVTYSTSMKKNHIHVSEKEFNSLSSQNFFIETSCYNNHLYGISKNDIEAVLAQGKTPVCIVDINGALKLKNNYGAKLVFAAGSKELCIKNILNKQISEDQKISLIMSLDVEYKNSVFCDEVITL